MKIFTKESLKQDLNDIAERGWIKSLKDTSSGSRNDGAAGNLLENLLGIEENNLPLPNASEWELKVQRKGTSSLLTLFHSEPSPTSLKFVPSVLLPKYGWPHSEAGKKYSELERSFRQTISAAKRSDRGFCVVVDDEKIKVSFDFGSVDARHAEWINSVKQLAGEADLDPMPYWGFSDLEAKISSKLHNTFYVTAEVKKEEGQEWFKYSRLETLRGFSIEGFISCLKEGTAFVDFDARTGHNHGTKFRIKKNMIPRLYRDVDLVFDKSQP
jgi:hypothetical protein